MIVEQTSSNNVLFEPSIYTNDTHEHSEAMEDSQSN
jgi:hypothetical protein